MYIFSLILLLIPPLIFYRLGMRKSLFTYGMTLFSIVFLLLGMVVASFATFIFTDQIRSWQIPTGWVNTIDIGTHFWMIFILPVVFIADLVRWTLYINIFHGNFLMWAIMFLVVYKIIHTWITAIETFNNHRAT